MNFLKNRHNLARFLLKPVGFAIVFFCLCGTSLFADENIEPIIIPATELLTPVVLVNGVVSELVVTPPKVQFAKLPKVSEPLLFVGGVKKEGNRFGNFLFAMESFCPSGPSSIRSREKTLAPAYDLIPLFSKFGKEPDRSDLKSIANLGLFAFFEICLSQSELPFRNSSMPCASSLSKSMIRKSANAWKSSWQPVKMTSLWPRSTFSLPILRISILERSLSLSRSMSDILSIWSNEMAEFPPTSWEMNLRAHMAQIRVALAKS